MRTRFHEDLEQLAQQLHTMCLHDRAAIAAATGGLPHADLEQCERAIEICQELDILRDQCEHSTMALLALQSPVAGELRKVVTAIQLVANLHRMGALTEHIADIARRRHPEHAVPASMAPIMACMAAAAVAMATAAAAVLASGDPDDAAQIEAQDDTIDRLHRELLAAVLDDDEDPSKAMVVDVTLLGRYYERFADHTVEVGRRTIFMATGSTPEEWSAARHLVAPTSVQQQYHNR
ncbi:phosphate signaling complex protein PhoU [Nocardia salmonicida]|uniref:phosphate signaling complex protein PhoU n=1 Tax=Nocardia salmonicida TaxID=53431 RepID=UPI00371405B5